MVMVMVLYRCWCLNSPRPLLRRLRPGHTASLNVWRSDTRPSDPVFVGPLTALGAVGVGEGGFVLICVTSHARVWSPVVSPLCGLQLRPALFWGLPSLKLYLLYCPPYPCASSPLTPMCAMFSLLILIAVHASRSSDLNIGATGRTSLRTSAWPSASLCRGWGTHSSPPTSAVCTA